MQIFINGLPHEVAGPRLTHEEIVGLADQPLHASVIYVGRRRGDLQRSGTTHPGKSVEIEDGMSFSAVVTGNA